MVKRALLSLAALGILAGVFYTLWAGSSERAAGEKRRLPARQAGEPVVTVETAAVQVGSIEEKLNYVGSLMPKSSVQVAPKITGRIEAVLVEVGDWVQKDQVLARLDKREVDEEVREAEASLKVQEATLEGREVQLRDLERRLDRAKILLQKDFISRQEMEDVQTQFYSALAQVELAKAQISQMKARLTNVRLRLADTEVISPFAGYVAQKYLDRGALVKPDSPVVSLVEVDPVKTVVSIVERDYTKVRPGVRATVAVDSYPGREFSGRVVRVSPVLDKDTRTADVEIEVQNPQELLKPGMFARVTLMLGRREGRSLVPEAALVRRGDGVGVFKLDGEEGRVRFTALEIGVTQDGKVEVIRGLAAGERVVTLGAHLLQDGARVRVAASDGPRSAKP